MPMFHIIRYLVAWPGSDHLMLINRIELELFLAQAIFAAP